MAEKTIGVDIDEELHERARLAALKRKVPVKALYAQGLTIVLDGSQAVNYLYAEKHRDIHEKLEHLLTGGDGRLIEAFFERLQPSAKRRAGGK